METPVNTTDEAAVTAHTMIVKVSFYLLIQEGIQDAWFFMKRNFLRQKHLSDLPNLQQKMKKLKASNFTGSSSTKFSTIESCLNRVSFILFF